VLYTDDASTIPNGHGLETTTSPSRWYLHLEHGGLGLETTALSSRRWFRFEHNNLRFETTMTALSIRHPRLKHHDLGFKMIAPS
jgi:hypothetical protein